MNQLLLIAFLLITSNQFRQPDYVSSVHSCSLEHTVMGVLINTSLPEEQLVSLNYVLIRIFISPAHVLFISILHVL